MKAKEMFEKLGWKLQNEGLKIVYFNREYNEIIEFDKEYEEYYVENLSIDMSTLQAIIQQCKELGWIE